MHESCKILGLSYGYPTVMLRLSFGKDSIAVRQRVGNGTGMERRWNMCGCRQNGDGLQKTFRSIGVLSRECRGLSWLIVKRWSSQIYQIK